MSWEKVKIPDVLFFQEGPGVRNYQFKKSGVKLLNVGNINKGILNLDATSIFISEEEAYNKYKHFLVDDGDLLIASSGIVVSNFHNKITWATKKDLPLCMNTSTIRFKSLDSSVLDIKYFSYYLQTRSFTDQLRKLITGSAQLNFGPSHLKQISLPLPPLHIQKQIANILDKADALRKKDQELLLKYDELAQSIFIDMFGDPVNNEKGWEVEPIEKMIDFLTSGSRGWSKYYSEKGDLFLRINNVGKNKLNLKDIIYVNTPKGAEAKRTKVRPKDILLSITADLGRTAVIPDNIPDAYVNQHLAIIRLKPNYNSFYVSQYISSEGGLNQIMKSNKGGVKAGLNFSDIKSLEIPLPPLNLQNKFFAISENLFRQKEQATLQIKKSESVFESLLQKAFTGELIHD